MVDSEADALRIGGLSPIRAAEVRRRLETLGAFDFAPLASGLFAASSGAGGLAESINYHYVWVRDNVYVAHCLDVVGKIGAAVRAARALAAHFRRQRPRFFDVIAGRADTREQMKRPHIRFHGDDLRELRQRWNHGQNDALGYFLWFFCGLILEGKLRPRVSETATLALFPLYLQRIQYWRDEDSGHWEESRKIEASSIGPVVAGLRRLQAIRRQPAIGALFERLGVTARLLDSLTEQGEQALADILPAECVQPEARRDVDAALLFLIQPLEVAGAAADPILSNVQRDLQGPIGIARYRGDTFWAPDYKRRMAPEERTSLPIEAGKRDQLPVRPGEEAQWCIFDSIVSLIYGRRFRQSRDPADRERQFHYLNRALAQLTLPSHAPLPPWRLPEAYYLEDGEWVPNDATPLTWAHANLRLALHEAEQSV